jgi:predicted 3-demethylubiquinone-9 3-methyltransferase (glyoxalase superfamily)
VATVQKITPCLWFDGNAEEAVTFYTSVFKNSKVLRVSRWGDSGPGPKGSVLTMIFELDGVELMALNGGPQYRFTEAISMMVSCDTQAEIDDFWAKLTAGGQEVECGWLKDRFGLSWQIVPRILGDLMTDKNPESSERVLQALMKMVKLDIATLKRAHQGVR